MTTGTVTGPVVDTRKPYDVLAAEADRYDEHIDRALRQYRREHDATFAADLDIQYPRPAARTTDELYQDVMAWLASLPRQASPWDILHTPRIRRAPVAWAEFSDDSVNSAELPPGDGIPSLAEAYHRPVLSGPAADENMPGRDGWTPTRPVIVVDIPAPDLVQTGPQGRFARWLDGQLQRAEQWWRGKQAERDRRMGVED
jgi:hypothetical protein